MIGLAVPAGASTGMMEISPEQAGYTATGAQFRTIRAHVFLRQPGQYAGQVASYRDSVQLWSSGLVVTVGGSGQLDFDSYLDGFSGQSFTQARVGTDFGSSPASAGKRISPHSMSGLTDRSGATV